MTPVLARAISMECGGILVLAVMRGSRRTEGRCVTHCSIKKFTPYSASGVSIFTTTGDEWAQRLTATLSSHPKIELQEITFTALLDPVLR